MKKLSLLGVVVLIILVTVIIGITILSYKNESTKKPEVVHEIKKLSTSSEKYDIYYEIYTLEGCEYIVIPGSYFTWGTHKGNCKNPIHKKYGEL